MKETIENIVKDMKKLKILTLKLRDSIKHHTVRKIKQEK